MVKRPIVIIKKEASQQVDELTVMLANANSQINSLTSQLSAKTSELSLANADIATLNNQIADINSQLSTANSNIASLNDSLDSANNTIATRDSTITSLNSQISTLNNSLTTANNTIASLNSQLSNSTATIIALNNSLTTANSTIATLNGQLTTANATIASRDSQISRMLTICGTTVYVANTSFTSHTNDVIIQPSKPVSGFRKDNFNVFIYCTIPTGKNCIKMIDLDWKGGTTTPLWNDSGWNLLARNVPIRATGNSENTGLNNWSIAGNGVQLDLSIIRRNSDSGNYVRILGINFGVSE